MSQEEQRVYQLILTVGLGDNILGGEVEHKDSWGGQTAIETGDIQWMTTGSGLIHSELVTDKFKNSGGVMQGLQIWVNLPQKNKKVKPWYQHIKKNDIPTIDEGNDVLIKVLVGKVKIFLQLSKHIPQF